jgi:hypothetical protein
LGRFLVAVKEIPVALLFKCLGVALVNFAFYYVQVYLMVRAFSEHVGLSAVAWFPTITLSTIIPYAIGGLGIRELVAAYWLSNYGLTWAAAGSAFFAHFVIIMILPGLVGAVWVGRVALPTVETGADPDRGTSE